MFIFQSFFLSDSILFGFLPIRFLFFGDFFKSYLSPLLSVHFILYFLKLFLHKRLSVVLIFDRSKGSLKLLKDFVPDLWLDVILLLAINFSFYLNIHLWLVHGFLSHMGSVRPILFVDFPLLIPVEIQNFLTSFSCSLDSFLYDLNLLIIRYRMFSLL